MKKILVLSTGGTIAAELGEFGFEPKPHMDSVLGNIPEITGRFDFDFENIMNMESSNIQPEEWKVIASAIWKKRNKYDAIIVTHGTDTMAYTASMLSYMLMGIKIPVVFTGSQIPATVEGTDATKNLVDSFLTASSDIQAGIYVVFDGVIMLGCRSKKLRTQSLNAFESVNFPNMGVIENGVVKLNEIKNLGFGSHPDKMLSKINKNVFLLKLVPGTKPEFFDMFAKMNYEGLVIEAFGVGGLHHIRRDLPKKIDMLLKKNIEVVVVSQCPYEVTDLNIYEVGHRIADVGVISGKDMTTEATVTKLMWALANKDENMTVRDIMLKNYCGEIS